MWINSDPLNTRTNIMIDTSKKTFKLSDEYGAIVIEDESTGLTWSVESVEATSIDDIEYWPLGLSQSRASELIEQYYREYCN